MRRTKGIEHVYYAHFCSILFSIISNNKNRNNLYHTTTKCITDEISYYKKTISVEKTGITNNHPPNYWNISSIVNTDFLQKRNRPLNNPSQDDK